MKTGTRSGDSASALVALLAALELPSLEAPITHRDLMLVGTVKQPTPGDWIYEIKFDGFRTLALRSADGAQLTSRKGNDITGRFPEVADELEDLLFACALDAELTVCDEAGIPDWHSMRRRFVMRKPGAIAAGAAEHPATLWVFDILALAGLDVRPRSLRDRRRLLEALLPAAGRRVRLVEQFQDGQTLFATAERLGLEGIVAKRQDSPYVGGRAKSWLKLRTAHPPRSRLGARHGVRRGSR